LCFLPPHPRNQVFSLGPPRTPHVFHPSSFPPTSKLWWVSTKRSPQNISYLISVVFFRFFFQGAVFSMFQADGLRVSLDLRNVSSPCFNPPSPRTPTHRPPIVFLVFMAPRFAQPFVYKRLAGVFRLASPPPLLFGIPQPSFEGSPFFPLICFFQWKCFLSFCGCFCCTSWALDFFSGQTYFLPSLF